MTANSGNLCSRPRNCAAYMPVICRLQKRGQEVNRTASSRITGENNDQQEIPGARVQQSGVGPELESIQGCAETRAHTNPFDNLLDRITTSPKLFRLVIGSWIRARAFIAGAQAQFQVLQTLRMRSHTCLHQNPRWCCTIRQTRAPALRPRKADLQRLAKLEVLPIRWRHWRNKMNAGGWPES